MYVYSVPVDARVIDTRNHHTTVQLDVTSTSYCHHLQAEELMIVSTAVQVDVVVLAIAVEVTHNRGAFVGEHPATAEVPATYTQAE